MNSKKNTLPDDVADLVSIINTVVSSDGSNPADKELASLAAEKLQHKHEELVDKIKILEEEKEKFKKLVFGKKSEKLTPEDILQGSLFNEAELHSDTETMREEKEETKEEIAKEVVEEKTEDKAEKKKSTKKKAVENTEAEAEVEEEMKKEEERQKKTEQKIKQWLGDE